MAPLMVNGEGKGGLPMPHLSVFHSLEPGTVGVWEVIQRGGSTLADRSNALIHIRLPCASYREITPNE